jgi:hypothetical protein
VHDDNTPTVTAGGPSMLAGLFGDDEAPSHGPNEPSAPSDAGVLGFAGRLFRIGYAGRGRGAPGT